MASWSAGITGDFRTNLAKIEQAHRQAATSATKRAGTTLKNAGRREVERGGLGKGIANSIRDQAFPPRGTSLDPAVIVYSKAVYKRPGGLVDLITVFREGATVVLALGLLLIGKRARAGKLVELRGKRLAQAKTVTIPARLKSFDAAYERAARTIQPNYERDVQRRIGA